MGKGLENPEKELIKIKRGQKMDKYKKILCIYALLFFSACGIATLILPDKEFSEEENRYLAKRPELTAKSLLNGDYQEEAKKYLSDQMVLRSGFMRLYALAQKSMGKSEYNGVYICKDGWLIERYEDPENTEYIAESLAYVSENTDAHCMLMLVPTAISLYPEMLPYGAGGNNVQDKVKKYIDDACSKAGMDIVDVWGALEKSKPEIQLYYKTDHHWTTDAAYAAYRAFCADQKMTPLEKSSFEIEKVSEDFYGTVYSKALTAFQPADTIVAYKQDMSGITVSYSFGEGSLYAEEYLGKKDKYAYFLNGSQSEITIENGNVKNGRTLLVVKDSYANCFVPFLVNHYEKIVVLDTRYYRFGVTAAAEDVGATDILFLFNLNTLDKDTAVAGIF